MQERYFRPWVGPRYVDTKFLIVSESTYSWLQDGDQINPSRLHPTESLQYWLEHFGKRNYFTAMSRALCGTKTPTLEKLRGAWDECAYTPYVQGTVGLGPKKRPTLQQFADAQPHFLSLLEELRPSKLVVTGKQTWNLMPDETVAEILPNLQAYQLSDGTLTWCLAVPHPSSRSKGQGFNWRRIHENIRLFRATDFPRSLEGNGLIAGQDEG